MRFLLFILFFTFFPPLQCQKSNYFFVTRCDTNETICTEPEKYFYTTFPTFDLDKLQIPVDVGFKYWDWLGDWQLHNYTDVRVKTDTNVLIAGNQPFHFLIRRHEWADVTLLASNITLWMAHENRPRGAGMLYEVDHLNETTKLKDTTLKYCDKNPEVEGAKCTILDYKNGTNHLNDGNHWTRFRIPLKENPTSRVEMIKWGYLKQKPGEHCTWKNANPLTSDEFDIFAKSHQRNAAIYTRGACIADLSNNKEMKKNYTKRSSGELCVDVMWKGEKSNDSNEFMEVKNLASGRVQPATNTTHNEDWLSRTFRTYFRWNHLDAGEYEFTLRFDKRIPRYIYLCQDDDSNIVKTWISIPKAITKCQFAVGEPYEFSAGPSSPPDSTLKPKWTLEEWEHVCDRLGIGSNDTEVQIKFCNLYVCNFSKCPHLQLTSLVSD